MLLAPLSLKLPTVSEKPVLAPVLKVTDPFKIRVEASGSTLDAPN
jgi:hypothetical protein